MASFHTFSALVDLASYLGCCPENIGFFSDLCVSFDVCLGLSAHGFKPFHSSEGEPEKETQSHSQSVFTRPLVNKSSQRDT